MRAIVTAPLLLFAFAACSSVWNEPRVLVSPYLAAYRLRGGTSLQQPGQDPGDPAVDTLAQRLSDFGQAHHRDDVGVRADIGDGFAGVRIDYYRLDMGATKGRPLTDAWGALDAGADAGLDAAMDELRVAWLEPLLKTTFAWRERPVTVQLAAGGTLGWRALDLRGHATDGDRQNLDVGGELIYGAVRGRAEYRGAALDVDFAISPDIGLGGDHEGVHHDVEVRGSYALPWRDVTLFGGWRYSKLRFEGSQAGLDYRADLVVDGFLVGVSLTF
jgi:hypothetical protein